MPCYIRVLNPDGSLAPVDYSAQSLADAGQYEPADGIYTVANTFHTYQTLCLDAHLDRMENSAKYAQVALKLNRPLLKSTLRKLITEADYGDVRFRITVGRETPEQYILSLEPFTPLAAEFYAQGVRCVTIPNSARVNANAKTTGWMHKRQKAPEGIYENLLLNAEGDILEGATSNFYAILNGELRTAADGMLPGIAQQIVDAVAPPIIPLHRQAVNVRDVPLLAEAFITSSSRTIVPVVEIDGHSLGTGQPGPYTRALREAYHAWSQAHLETL